MAGIEDFERVDLITIGIRILEQQAKLRDRLGASEETLGNAERAKEYAYQAKGLRFSAEKLADLIEE